MGLFIYIFFCNYLHIKIISYIFALSKSIYYISILCIKDSLRCNITLKLAKYYDKVFITL